MRSFSVMALVLGAASVSAITSSTFQTTISSTTTNPDLASITTTTTPSSTTITTTPASTTTTTTSGSNPTTTTPDSTTTATAPTPTMTTTAPTSTTTTTTPVSTTGSRQQTIANNATSTQPTSQGAVTKTIQFTTACSDITNYTLFQKECSEAVVPATCTLRCQVSENVMVDVAGSPARVNLAVTAMERKGLRLASFPTLFVSNSVLVTTFAVFNYSNHSNVTQEECVEENKSGELSLTEVIFYIIAVCAVVVSSLITTFGLFFQKIAQIRFKVIADTKQLYQTLHMEDSDVPENENVHVLEDDNIPSAQKVYGGPVSSTDKDVAEMAASIEEGESDEPVSPPPEGLVAGNWQDELEPNYVATSCCCWFTGFFFITILSFGLDMFAVTVVGQALVVPLLASLEVAENQLFAPFILKEHFNKVFDISAAVIIVIGAVLTTVFGPKQGGGGLGNCGEEAVNIFELFTKTPFLIFGTIALVLAVVCCCLMWLKNCPQLDRIKFLMFAYVCGFLGGFQNLFLKGLGTLLRLAMTGYAAQVFFSPEIYVFSLSMLGLAISQLIVLNQGLAKFPALLFVPSYTVLYIFMGTAVGLVFYEEYKQMDLWPNWVLFSVGFGFIITALLILAFKPNVKEDEELDKQLTPSPQEVEMEPTAAESDAEQTDFPSLGPGTPKAMITETGDKKKKNPMRRAFRSMSVSGSGRHLISENNVFHEHLRRRSTGHTPVPSRKKSQRPSQRPSIFNVKPSFRLMFGRTEKPSILSKASGFNLLASGFSTGGAIYMKSTTLKYKSAVVPVHSPRGSRGSPRGSRGSPSARISPRRKPTTTADRRVITKAPPLQTVKSADDLSLEPVFDGEK